MQNKLEELKKAIHEACPELLELEKCLKRNRSGRYRHGMNKTPLYKKWSQMKTRCLNKKERSYKDYGGRGIKICAEWMDFINFMNDMGDSFKQGLSLERVDNNGNYCKENCKWIELKLQARNKRNIPLYELNGCKKSAAEWSEITGTKAGTISARIKYYKWPVKRALEQETMVAKGYSFNKNRNKFVATANIKGKQIFLGRFDKKEDAIKAREDYDLARQKQTRNHRFSLFNYL